MAARYQIWLKDQSGTRVALFDDFVRMDYAHRVNAPGSCTLVIDGDDSRCDLFETDGQLEVWREDPVNGIALYLEWEGLVITTRRGTDSNGRATFTVYATGYADLLGRRVVAWYAESAGAAKSGAASSVMWSYVYQNAGPGATVGAGRLASGVTAGLTVSPDPGVGATWTGERAYKNLLDVLQGIAEQMSIDFDVIGTGAGTFAFTLYNTQRGEDRTTSGIDPTTGLNSAGNAPVIFALEFGNMATPQYALARDGTANRIYVLGPGSGSSRSVVICNDGADAAASPINTREVTRNANSEPNTTAMTNLGMAELAKLGPRESFAFGVLQVPSTLYGKHYTWGDRVTARYEGIERDKRITGIRVSVSSSNKTIESIGAELTDISTWALPTRH